MTETTHAPATREDSATAHTIGWLEQEFPGWTIDVDETATWEGDLRPLWIARRDGHHPQAELSAAKLHTRVADYLDREQQRNSFGN